MYIYRVQTLYTFSTCESFIFLCVSSFYSDLHVFQVCAFIFICVCVCDSCVCCYRCCICVCIYFWCMKWTNHVKSLDACTIAFRYIVAIHLACVTFLFNNNRTQIRVSYLTHLHIKMLLFFFSFHHHHHQSEKKTNRPSTQFHAFKHF